MDGFHWVLKKFGIYASVSNQCLIDSAGGAETSCHLRLEMPSYKCTGLVHQIPLLFFLACCWDEKFSLDALNWMFTGGLLGWFIQVALLKMILLSFGSYPC
ncbi:hypothetical protein Peur_038389 [Populus x canadensis]